MGVVIGGRCLNGFVLSVAMKEMVTSWNCGGMVSGESWLIASAVGRKKFMSRLLFLGELHYLGCDVASQHAIVTNRWSSFWSIHYKYG